MEENVSICKTYLISYTFSYSQFSFSIKFIVTLLIHQPVYSFMKRLFCFLIIDIILLIYLFIFTIIKNTSEH